MFDRKIYEKLRDYCAARERSALDVKGKLLKLKAEKKDENEYIAKLRSENFLNESRYAKSFIDSRAHQKWGRLKIKHALSAKGISSGLIAEQLGNKDNDQYDAQLEELALKKWRSIRSGEERDKKYKLMRFLAGRGYEPDKIRKAVERVSH